MLNLFCRPVATCARLRFIWIAVPLASAWMLVAPMVYAAETMAMPMETGMLSSPPLKHYQKWRDEPVQDWSAANARVGEIGGWRTYLREAQQGEGGAAPNSQGQQGHQGH